MLTEKKAIELSITLWTWLTETGKDKSSWPDWDKYSALSDCFLCEYTCECNFDYSCLSCPYYREFGHCAEGYYGDWYLSKTIKARKKYAGLFLGQLKQLLEVK